VHFCFPDAVVTQTVVVVTGTVVGGTYAVVVVGAVVTGGEVVAVEPLDGTVVGVDELDGIPVDTPPRATVRLGAVVVGSLDEAAPPLDE
jgi:hypothetical protein